MKLIKHFDLIPKTLIKNYALSITSTHELIEFGHAVAHAFIHVKILQILILVLLLL